MSDEEFENQPHMIIIKAIILMLMAFGMAFAAFYVPQPAHIMYFLGILGGWLMGEFWFNS